MTYFYIGYDGRLYLVTNTETYCEITDMNRARHNGGRIMIEEVVVAFGYGDTVKESLITALNSLLVPIEEHSQFFNAYNHQDLVEWV